MDCVVAVWAYIAKRYDKVGPAQACEFVQNERGVVLVQRHHDVTGRPVQRSEVKNGRRQAEELGGDGHNQGHNSSLIFDTVDRVI